MSDVEKEKTINLGKVNQTKLKLNWKKFQMSNLSVKNIS